MPAEDMRARVEQAVARAAQAHELWSPGGPLVVAVSGGADSLCLLGALLSLRESGNPLAPGELIVAHLDHGLRGDAGAADALWVSDLATRHGLRCVTERADVATLAREERRSLEDAARHARYAFLRRVAHEAGAERVCTGHTSDDQAETVVLHWLHGAGLAGLAGMAPLSAGIARPLLEVMHDETVAYCAARGWEPREDSTNTSLQFLRNRVRHQLLPMLERYNPNLRTTLTRNAALIGEDERYLDALTEAAWRRVIAGVDQEDGVVRLALETLGEEPLALRRRLVRRAVRVLVGDDGPQLEARHVFLLDALLEHATTGKQLHFPSQLAVTREYGALRFERRDQRRAALADAPAPGQEWRLRIPGAADLPAIGWRVRAEILSQPPGLERNEPAALPANNQGSLLADLGRGEARVYLDADVAGTSLVVRLWRPGDRFRPLGMAHEKKLQDFFADAKTPRALRGRIPLVWNDKHTLWVAGQRLDDRARLTAATRRVLCLTLESLARSSSPA